MKKTIIVIAGPTAVGKTAVAIRLAQYYKTSILSADSRQCYRELDIGVAKPSPEELAAVPHHFINSHSIHHPVDAAAYEQYALQSIDEIFAHNDIAIVVGGTGLYIKALCEGMDAMPGIPAQIRDEVRDGFYNNGLSWLQQQVQALDPLYFSTGEIQNPHRLMRALEFVKTTGESIKAYQKARPKERPFRIIKIGLELPRPELNERINLRVDQMIGLGLEEEVRSLVPFKHLPALQTVGYSEFFDHFDGLSSAEAAIEFIKRNTRQYAKRQMTWFKKDGDIKWYSPEKTEDLFAYLGTLL